MAVRARQVREVQIATQGGNMHPQVWKLLCDMAEEQHQLQKTLAECVGAMSMVVATTESFNMIAEGMKKKIDQIGKNMQDPTPDMGSNN